MGKRSRKRTGSSPVAGPDDVSAGAGSTRAERDAARARRADVMRRGGTPSGATSARSGDRQQAARRTVRGERAPAPWGSFPLVEICVLLALVLLIGGFVTGGGRGATMVLAGLALGSLAGLELSIREHFGGFRSHTTLLAGAIALLVGTVVAFVAGKILLPLLLGIAVVVFAVSFYVFRRAFRRASGGLSFR